MTAHKQLVVTAIGTDRTGIVSELTKAISDCSCNILDSRMAIFGNEFTFIMLLEGDSQSISRVEHVLPVICQALGLLTMSKPTASHQDLPDYQTWELNLTGNDSLGIINKVSTYLAKSNIHIAALRTNCFEPEDQTQRNSDGSPMMMTIANYELRVPQEIATKTQQDDIVNAATELGLSADISITIKQD